MRSLASGIELSADLQCEFEGKPFSLTASSRRFVIDFADLASCLKVLRNRPARTQIRNDLARLNSLLNELQITLELRIRGTSVATAGFKTAAPLENLLGFKNLKLHPVGIFKSATSRRTIP